MRIILYNKSRMLLTRISQERRVIRIETREQRVQDAREDLVLLTMRETSQEESIGVAEFLTQFKDLKSNSKYVLYETMFNSFCKQKQLAW